MRVMDLEMRTWYGAPAYFVLGAVHAVVFWLTVSFFTPFVLLVACSTSAGGCLHDMLLGTVVINNAARAAACARRCRRRRSRDYDESRARARCLRHANRHRGLTHVTQHSRDTPQFYLTAPSPCPYLTGQEERKVFTHLVGDARRRVERPAHPWRLPPQPVDRLPAGLRDLPRLRVGARDRRTISRRRATCGASPSATPTSIGEMRAPVPTSEQYSVFRAYLDTRHRDGGMADMTVLDYAMMVEDSHVETRLVEYRRRGPDSGASTAAAPASCSRSR